MTKEQKARKEYYESIITEPSYCCIDCDAPKCFKCGYGLTKKEYIYERCFNCEREEEYDKI